MALLEKCTLGVKQQSLANSYILVILMDDYIRPHGGIDLQLSVHSVPFSTNVASPIAAG